MFEINYIFNELTFLMDQVKPAAYDQIYFDDHGYHNDFHDGNGEHVIPILY